jgi:late competence protein required for DNA uptake (superfamily II DNA/RNA helicase)
MNDMLKELIAEQHDRGGQYRMIQRTTRTTTLIDIQERQKLRCAKCGTNLSVKYRTTIDGKEKCFCNICILTV